MRHPYFDLPTPIVFGHRGASGEAPENTLEAFALALEQGAHVIETDVHRSADGVVVTLHDHDVARTTDGEGDVASFRFAELRRLDAGHGFTPDAGRSHPWRGREVRIPSLREVFEAFPGIRFNIEIKRDEDELVEATLEEIGRAGREKLTLLAAGEDGTMRRLRAAQQRRGLHCALGASPADVLGFVRAALDGTAPPREPMALQVPGEFGGRPLVTPELVAFAHRHDVQVHVWTVNERAEMERLLDLEVDGVMSDFPGRLAELVAARRGPA